MPSSLLYLYSPDNAFITKRISLANNQRVKIGRHRDSGTRKVTAPSAHNGYFDSMAISRRHAEVWEEGGKIYIRDTKSANGTFLNGERLSDEGVKSDPFWLKNDDVVEFGIDIVANDSDDIVHRKVVTRVSCVFGEENTEGNRGEFRDTPKQKADDDDDEKETRADVQALIRKWNMTGPVRVKRQITIKLPKRRRGKGNLDRAQEGGSRKEIESTDLVEIPEGESENDDTLHVFQDENRYATVDDVLAGHILKPCLANDRISEWTDILYTSLSDKAMDVDTCLRLTRLLAKLIVSSGKYPRPLVLRNVSREVDASGKLRDLVFAGGFGDIYRGSLSGSTVAIKRLRPLRYGESDQLKAFVKEVLVLSTLRHTFIVPFLGVSEEIDGVGNTPCIIFPWYNNGNMEQYLKNTTHTEQQLAAWSVELIQGMKYIHTRPIPVIHGDLRAANILVDDEHHVRIADFGLSQLARSTATMTKTMGAGTLQWKAPEMVAPDENDGESDNPSSLDSPLSLKSKATDAWAVGCTIYEMYEGRYPYHHLCRGSNLNIRDEYRILDALRQGQRPAQARPTRPNSRSRMSAEVWKIVFSCWERDPIQRPDMAKLVFLLKRASGGNR